MYFYCFHLMYYYSLYIFRDCSNFPITQCNLFKKWMPLMIYLKFYLKKSETSYPHIYTVWLMYTHTHPTPCPVLFKLFKIDINSSHPPVKLFFFLFGQCLLRVTPETYGGSQARGRIGAAAASLHHSHSNARSEPSLRPTPQLMAMLDP